MDEIDICGWEDLLYWGRFTVFNAVSVRFIWIALLFPVHGGNWVRNTWLALCSARVLFVRRWALAAGFLAVGVSWNDSLFLSSVLSLARHSPAFGGCIERFNQEVPIRGAVELADELQGALFIWGDAMGAGLKMLIVGDKSVPPVVEVFIKREMNRCCDSKSCSVKTQPTLSIVRVPYEDLTVGLLLKSFGHVIILPTPAPEDSCHIELGGLFVEDLIRRLVFAKVRMTNPITGPHSVGDGQ